MKTCKTCGKPINRGGATTGSVARCIICRVADQMRTFTYTPDPYAVVDYREDEGEWAAPRRRLEARRG